MTAPTNIGTPRAVVNEMANMALAQNTVARAITEILFDLCIEVQAVAPTVEDQIQRGLLKLAVRKAQRRAAEVFR